MTHTVMTSLAEGDVGEAASPGTHPVQWWYSNALLEAPGTPLDGMALVGVFSLFDGVIEEGRHLLLSPVGGSFADFGTGSLSKGTIRASSSELDVRNGPNCLYGGYPDYRLHIEGEAASGARITVDLSYTAEVEPEREGYIDSQLHHYVVYRLSVSGTVTIGQTSYPVHGVGYLEHLFGTLGWLEPYLGAKELPTFIDGWNWYWSPAAGPDEVTVQLVGMITEGVPLPFVSVSADGKTFSHFVTGKFEVLAERTVEGVPHAHQLRITDRNDTGAVDLTITRRDAAHRVVKRAPGGSKVVFVTGFAELAGKVTLDGREYDVSGPAFGSAFTVSLTPPMLAARKLPSSVRVPLGRLLSALQRAKARSGRAG